MGDRLKKGPLCGVGEDLGSDPTAVRDALRIQAGGTPAVTELADADVGLKDLPGQTIGVDDDEAQLGKAGGRGRLAATDASGESDDHALPYPAAPLRANLKQGSGRIAGPGRHQRPESGRPGPAPLGREPWPERRPESGWLPS